MLAGGRIGKFGWSVFMGAAAGTMGCELACATLGVVVGMLIGIRREFERARQQRA